LHPENFPGPEVLLVGRIDEETIRQAATLMLRYTRKAPSETASIVVRTPRTTQTRSFPVAPAPENVK